MLFNEVPSFVSKWQGSQGCVGFTAIIDCYPPIFPILFYKLSEHRDVGQDCHSAFPSFSSWNRCRYDIILAWLMCVIMLVIQQSLSQFYIRHGLLQQHHQQHVVIHTRIRCLVDQVVDVTYCPTLFMDPKLPRYQTLSMTKIFPYLMSLWTRPKECMVVSNCNRLTATHSILTSSWFSLADSLSTLTILMPAVSDSYSKQYRSVLYKRSIHSHM